MNASYRLQLTPDDFGFAAVRALIPYFRRLGISHLYLSPITEARQGSTHGYDVVDHNQVREAFGGRAGLEALRAAAVEAGLELILDFVPNHAGVGPRNDYWQDVLAYGPYSPYAKFFDIDWDPLKSELTGRVLLPFLGSPYGDALDGGEIDLDYQEGRFYATYYDNRFALSPASYAVLLDNALPDFERTDVYFDLKDLAEAYQDLSPDEREAGEGLRRRLVRLNEQIDLGPVLSGYDAPALHDLLELQYWRLSYWKTASHDINYRRFFDINELVGLCMQRSDVFWEAHTLLGELVTEEGVAGVRIDHIDGLFDPHGYLEHLRELGARRVWVEKILAPGETMPETWYTSGTTGYEFLNDAMGVLTDPSGEIPITRIYRRFVDDVTPYDKEVHNSKRLVMETSLSGELFRLANVLDRLSEADYHTRDFTLESLREALAEVTAAFPRYRTYLPHNAEEAAEVIGDTITRAKRRNPATELSVYDFIERSLIGEVRDDLEEARRAFVGRFQQYTAPVAAKGVEDTTFYRYLPLVALNEVGGEPDHFGVAPHAFHARAKFRAYRYPDNLLTTATHDHKRGEDTRMRLIALAEMPDLWQRTLTLLEQEVRRQREASAAPPFTERPSRNDEYLFYQLLVALYDGAEPSTLADRLAQYMEKAVREAKLRSSWLNPDESYERTLTDFVRAMTESRRVRRIIGPLAAKLAACGFQNTLAQTILKITTPGVPDFYQGSELFDLSLVDPDNRKPVDYERRRRMLDELEPLLNHPEPEHVRNLYEHQTEFAKLYVTSRLLRFRSEHADLFAGDYRVLEPQADAAEHTIAYAREAEREALIVVIPRFPATPARRHTLPLPEALHGRDWQEVLTGERVAADTALDMAARTLPFTVLYSKTDW